MSPVCPSCGGEWWHGLCCGIPATASCHRGKPQARLLHVCQKDVASWPGGERIMKYLSLFTKSLIGWAAVHINPLGRQWILSLLCHRVSKPMLMIIIFLSLVGNYYDLYLWLTTYRLPSDDIHLHDVIWNVRKFCAHMYLWEMLIMAKLESSFGLD